MISAKQRDELRGLGGTGERFVLSALFAMTRRSPRGTDSEERRIPFNDPQS
jgi:hypothetical protein